MTLKAPAPFDAPIGIAPAPDEASRFAARANGVEIARVAPGERLVVAAWKTGQERRKHFAAAALYDEDRSIIAAAEAAGSS